MTMTGNDRFSKILSHKPSLHFLPILSKCSNWFPKYRCKVLSVRHLRTPPKKSVAKKFVFNSKLLYLCTSNRKKASLVPKVGRYRRHIWVSIDARCRTSMTTQTRARNGASGELKYQPSKHTKSMINYSITMRSVNSNLLIGSICHLLIVAYRPLLYLRNPRAKPFLFGFYNQRFL